MPEISRFFGVVVRMFFNEHNPPHNHVEFQDSKAVFDLAGNITHGGLRSRTAVRAGASGSTFTSTNSWRIGNLREPEGNPTECPTGSKGAMWNLNDVVEFSMSQITRTGSSSTMGAMPVVDFSEYLDRGPVFVPLLTWIFSEKPGSKVGTIALPLGSNVNLAETLYDKCRPMQETHLARPA